MKSVGGDDVSGSGRDSTRRLRNFKPGAFPRKTTRVTTQNHQTDAMHSKAGWKGLGARCRHVFSPPVGSCNWPISKCSSHFPSPARISTTYFVTPKQRPTSRSSAPIKSEGSMRRPGTSRSTRRPLQIPRRAAGRWTRAALMVWRISRAIGLACRHGDAALPGVGAANAVGQPTMWWLTKTVKRGLDPCSPDRVTRLDPKSGQMTDYLLPRSTNIRRVVCRTIPNAGHFLGGNDHGASSLNSNR